jgi:hypothetical protein
MRKKLFSGRNSWQSCHEWMLHIYFRSRDHKCKADLSWAERQTLSSLPLNLSYAFGYIPWRSMLNDQNVYVCCVWFMISGPLDRSNQSTSLHLQVNSSASLFGPYIIKFIWYECMNYLCILINSQGFKY